MRVVLLVVLLLLSLGSVTAQTDVKASSGGSPGRTVILQPEADDISLAAERGLNVFKILRRGTIRDENEFGIRGGGAYYSFTKESHSYNEFPQLGLEKDFFMVGFYGANYGFLADLGEVDISSPDVGSREMAFLKAYKPPQYLDEIRIDQLKSHDHEIDGMIFKNHNPAVKGHAYALRAIGFREADTLVLFTVHRLNPDGSAIIFWKPVRQFEVPTISYYTGAQLKAKTDEILADKKYEGVTSEIVNDEITVRGKLLHTENQHLTWRLQNLCSKRVNNEITLTYTAPVSK